MIGNDKNLVINRHNGIELLRIISILMVTILHILGHGGVLETSKQEPLMKTISYYVVWNACLCAVDIFAIISGFMSKTRVINIKKIFRMWMQVVFYSFVVSAVLFFIGLYSQEFFGDLKIFLIKMLLPISNEVYWYFSSYALVCILSPFINLAIDCMKEKELRNTFKIFVILIILSSFFDTSFGLRKGASPIWLLLLFVLGKLIKKTCLFEKISTNYLVILICCLTIVTLIPYAIFGKGLLSTYLSPTIVGQAMCYVVIFARVKIKSTIISNISKLTFGCYLFQENPIVRQIFIKNKFSFIAQKNLIVGLILVLLFATVIMIVGIFVERIRICVNKCTILLFNVEKMK